MLSLRPCIALAAVAAALFATPVRAQFVVTDPLAVAESVRQTFQMAAQLEQIRRMVQNAQEHVQLARDVYAGINEIRNFNPDEFLAQGQAYFLGESGLGDAWALGDSLRTHGLEGGNFNPRSISSRLDVYRDRARREAAAGTGVAPPAFDAERALTASDLIKVYTLDPAHRRRLLSRPLPSSPADGLLAADMMASDGSGGLAQLFAYRVAQARDGEEKSLKLVQEAFCGNLPAAQLANCLSPGKAQQLSARSDAIAAVELTRLNEKMARSLSMEELKRLEEAAAAARARQEHDALWNNLGSGIRRTLSGSAPKDQPSPSMGER